MRRRATTLLTDALSSGERIATWTHALSWEHNARDRQIQAADEREFEILGEALNRLSRHFPAVAAEIPELRSVVGFRNMLSHGYDAVDQRVVWSLAKRELASLMNRLRNISLP